MMEPVLVFGDDASPDADVAWLWINNHRWPGWRADIITAELPQFPPSNWDYLPEQLQRWDPPTPRLAFRESGLAELRYLRAQADPRAVLDGCGAAGLLVIGRGQLGHLRTTLLGSTAEWLLHHHEDPLVIVRSAASVRRILFCTDGSDHANAAARVLAGIPWISTVDITVLGVYDGWADTEAGFGAAMSILKPVARSFATREVRGKAAHEILAFLDDNPTDLVAFGTRGRSGWSRLRLGSTASTVSRAAPCSVLVATSATTQGHQPDG